MIIVKIEDKEIIRDVLFYKKINMECDKLVEILDNLCEDVINL